MTNTPGRRRWWPRPRKISGPARPPAPVGGDRPSAVGRDRPSAVGGDRPSAVGAVQLAIGLLTASLDSPELEEWAESFLVPEDPEALASVIAGLHLVCLFLLQQVQEATGQPPARTLQKLAIAAAAGPQTPFTG